MYYSPTPISLPISFKHSLMIALASSSTARPSSTEPDLTSVQLTLFRSSSGFAAADASRVEERGTLVIIQADGVLRGIATISQKMG